MYVWVGVDLACIVLEKAQLTQIAQHSMLWLLKSEKPGSNWFDHDLT